MLISFSLICRIFTSVLTVGYLLQSKLRYIYLCSNCGVVASGLTVGCLLLCLLLYIIIYFHILYAKRVQVVSVISAVLQSVTKLQFAVILKKQPCRKHRKDDLLHIMLKNSRSTAEINKDMALSMYYLMLLLQGLTH